MKISVIIPTYNSEQTIGLCIEALQHQERLPDEVIVVDNNSTDNTVKIVNDLAKKVKFPHLTCLTESKRGPASARNKGIKCTTGNIIAFTDSDCIPRSDWIKSIYSNFIEDKELDILGGVVFGYSPKNTVQKFYAVNWNRQYGNKSMELLLDIKKTPLSKCIFTNNAAYRRKFIEKIGLFDESFSAAATEDLDYCYRALEAKAKIKNYVLEVVVFHIDRDSVRGIIRQYFGYGAYNAKLAKKHFPHSLIIELPFGTWKIWQNIPKLIWIKITTFHIFVACLLLIFINKIFLILLFLFLLSLARRTSKSLENIGVKASSVEQIGILVLYLLAKASLVFGRIYTSIRYRSICI